MTKPILASLALIASIAACDVGQVEPAPTPPTELSATAVGGAVHLTWKDNSIDEMHFMVMRMVHDPDAHGGAAEMTALATLAENATEYHDAAIESGMTYMYQVAAMNDVGESDSNEIELVAP
jgi:hypothetical protein